MRCAILSHHRRMGSREIDMKITGLIAVSAVAAAMLVTIFGLRSVVDPDGTTARAGTTSPSAISVYDFQRGAHGLETQQFDAI
jgi:hypothetical protein